MKFRFKIQKYQTEAVESVVQVFDGQPRQEPFRYRRDTGHAAETTAEMFDAGFRNAEVQLSKEKLLENIHRCQDMWNIPRSERLVTDGKEACRLDVEMETGTGKTYVYIKTMFELNRRYGWTKFIVVVPNLAIREGVLKSFQMLEEHFMEQYQKRARYFVYDSDRLQLIDAYSSDANINVMIINAQAFNRATEKAYKDEEEELRNGKKQKLSSELKIFQARDEFGSRRPIDVLSANRPIIILDEPQKLEGDATQKSLQAFNPLFILNYSATHRTKHNLVYALDALDAYRQKLVKKIFVKSLTVDNLRGTQAYLYLDDFILSKNSPPEVRIELEVQRQSGIRREMRRFRLGDRLSEETKTNAYNGYTISEIDPLAGTVTFLNGVTIHRGQVLGDKDERTIQRLQIRETIQAHFDKEEELFRKGIKCLSLFFIDEVANYKSYQNGDVVHGYLWKTFEEEYNSVLNERLSLFDEGYRKYLKGIATEATHSGYFSIDKQGHEVDSHVARTEKKSGVSDDISAYDLILKNKERLLSFDEPVRFIFSHSALQEGWDNPNVFQICTLQKVSSTIKRRQEVGRGLRLCVNQAGERMDSDVLGDEIHNLNRLTVVSNEEYGAFVDGLQKEIREALRERPVKADVDYFKGKTITLADGTKHQITEAEARHIITYLDYNSYIDDHGRITDDYKKAVDCGQLVPMVKSIESMSDPIHQLIRAIYDENSGLDDLVEDGNATEVRDCLNQNWKKDEFQELWRRLNHQYVYTVHYDSAELVEKAVESIRKNLMVKELVYQVTEGVQADQVDAFSLEKTHREKAGIAGSDIKYDLVGDIAKGATLTRATALEILRKIGDEKLKDFRRNPEEFIRNVTRLIREAKATMVVEHVSYSMTDGKYDSAIFTNEKHGRLDRSVKTRKCITDYIFSDGYSENPEQSVEGRFAKDMDAADEVAVYAKLPRSFKIPTPVGDYSPDWAVAFEKDSVKHIYFVAETKGSMDSMDLRPIEKAKIDCAKKLFNEISTEGVKYHEVASYEDLLNVMEAIPEEN